MYNCVYLSLLLIKRVSKYQQLFPHSEWNFLDSEFDVILTVHRR